MLKLTVLVPVYNEEKTVLQVLEAVKKQSIPNVEIEVVVVNDGSKDRTAELLVSRPDLYKTFVNLKKNLGKGGAVKAGLAAAKGDYVIFQDGDLEYDPSEFENLLFPALKFDADIVMGSRLLSPKYTRVHYYWNKQGNWLITFIFNVLFNMTFTDIYTCYFMFRRSLIDPAELKTEGFEQQAEILALCVKRGKVFYDVPISYHGRPLSEGKKIRAYHIFAVIWQIIYKRFV